HQDWNYVDERFYDSLNLWIPLQDVDEHNGCLTFLPMSHRVCYTLRTAPAFAGLFDNVMPLAEKAMVPVPLKTGEAVLFFHATLHGSVPNRSAQRRANVVLGVYTGGKLSHHYLTGEGSRTLIEKFAIDKEKFFLIKDLRRPPTDWLIETVSFNFPQLTPEEFQHLYPETGD
ncbi:MAG TPA: phytanoyl-CoA dioxygenase family protein, partial [Chitinophagales bacterium]|nr:phytanoyl-CoA dioxygenase family protein [Chitinophagales bacterium]